MTQFQITHSRTWGHNLTATLREKPKLRALPAPLGQEEIREILSPSRGRVPMKVNDFERALEGLETVIGWMVEDHHDLAISAIPRDTTAPSRALTRGSHRPSCPSPPTNSLCCGRRRHPW